jgi:hypothetical protein
VFPTAPSYLADAIRTGIERVLQLRPSLALSYALLSLTTLTIVLPVAAATEKKEADAGPIYVPLDSWVYPALKRLAALGYVPDEESLVAPWTRKHCSELVGEAQDITSRHSIKVSTGALNVEAQKLIADLSKEFSGDHAAAASARIESVYSQVLQISGAPLRDSYHFGQTLVNDYGRPFEEGANTVDGFSTFATAGRFSAYFRGEYQEAGSRGPGEQSLSELLGALDGVPAPQSTGNRLISAFDPLEMYVGASLGLFDVTFGKQSVSWGPGEASQFSFSDNAEPFYSLRISQQSPIVLPGLFRLLGRIRTEMLIGKLSGHLYPPHPFINGQKITLQLSEDLEVGFTRSAIFGGAGHPLITRSIFESFFGTSSIGGTAYGSANDPGDRRSGFDFRWRLPGLRRAVTIYSDSLADDEPNPLDSPRRSAWGPGIYFPKLLRLNKLDLRFETYSTWLYTGDEGGMFFYWNNQYRDAYTNNQYLLGSWVGRDARAYVATSTYWWSAKKTLMGTYRQTKTGANFLPGGGTKTDVSIKGQWQLKPDILGTAFVQYERYLIPVLGGAKRDVSIGMQFVFYPSKWSVGR